VHELNWVWVDGGSVVVSLAPASEEEEEDDWGRPELCDVRPSDSGFPRIVCQTGFGDGNYPVGGRYRNGQLVEVRIRFILIVPPQTTGADAPETIGAGTAETIGAHKSNFGTPGFEIPRPELPAIFFEALNVAGTRLQQEFNQYQGRVPASLDYRWINAELTYPSFADFTFAYGNQLFAVLVDLCADGESFLHDDRRDKLLEACSQHNLVPCRFQVSLKMAWSSDSNAGVPVAEPAGEGWNLTHFITGQPIVPADLATDTSVPMSEWELRNFAIQVVRNHIKTDLACRIDSFCDDLKIDPQIWFEDANGKLCWVVVRHVKHPGEAAISHWTGLESRNSKLKAFDGFFAGVSFAPSSSGSHGIDGNPASLAESDSKSTRLMRGEVFHISFDGLKRIFVAVGKELPTDTNEIETLTAEQAITLAQHEGWLSLNGLTTLSDKSAEALAGYDGVLVLSGLTTLRSEGLAAKLAHQDEYEDEYGDDDDDENKEEWELFDDHRALCLDSLVTVSDEAVQAIAKHNGPVSLSGVTELSHEAATALGQHTGGWPLFLGDLTMLSVEVAQALAEHKGSLSLTGPSKLSFEAAQAIAQHKGYLSLDGLITLTPEVAEALAQHEGGLCLPGLTTLSDEAANALAQHEGPLSLPGLSALSPEAAEVLAHKKGWLYLGCLTTLSDEAAAALRANPEIELPDKFKR
jgi:hypothetical protein